MAKRFPKYIVISTIIVTLLLALRNNSPICLHRDSIFCDKKSIPFWVASVAGTWRCLFDTVRDGKINEIVYISASCNNVLELTMYVLV